VSTGGRSAALAALAVVLTSPDVRATDFHVIELQGAYDLHRTGGGHASFGAGYTFDTFITTPALRGLLLSGRFDLLHCSDCNGVVDGGALVVSPLFTWWKTDLSSITPYVGLSAGGGYESQPSAAFALFELQVAVQFRAIYQGIWVRPSIYLGGGGAYDGYTSAGLRLAIGFSPNHGTRYPDEPPPLHPGACDPPPDVTLPPEATTWVVPNCYRANVAAKVDGHDVDISDQNGDLVVHIGPAARGTVQNVEVLIAGGVIPTTIARK
jgi:hypothetical protein